MEMSLRALASQYPIIPKRKGAIAWFKNTEAYKYRDDLIQKISLYAVKPKSIRMVRSHIASETGHDKLVKKSLKDLGFPDPNKLDFFAQTKLLLDILNFSSTTSVLAFATIIDFFESGSMSKMHPIAKILNGTAYAKAGVPLQRHRDINLGESHSPAAFSFLLTPATCTAREIFEAVKLFELAIISKRQMISRLTAVVNVLLENAQA